MGLNVRKPVLGGGWGGNNKGADKTARMRRLVCAFVVGLLESIISNMATSNISLYSAQQAGLGMTWSETPKDRFSHVTAHIQLHQGHPLPSPS